MNICMAHRGWQICTNHPDRMIAIWKEGNTSPPSFAYDGEKGVGMLT
jgi:hypothetical protein